MSSQSETLRTAEERLAEIRFPADRGVAGWVLSHNEALRIDDVSKDPRFYQGVDQATREEHSCRPKGVLRAVVVHRRVVAVPDELDAFAHAGVRTVRDAAVNAGSASAAKT